MLILDRKRKLIDLLHDRKTARLEELARELNVSVATVRRDIDSLAHTGIVERFHGGAVYQGLDDGSPPADHQHGIELESRMHEQVDAKKAIGKYAASLVRPQMTVLLDGGSTVIYTATQITARPIQIVTNSIAIANIFTDDDEVELVLIGGSLYPRTGVVVGPIATGCLADLHADLLLFSAAGIWEDAAFNQNMAMAQVEQAMMRQAARSVLLMDSTKFGRKSLTRVCGLSELEQIVTDRQITVQWTQRLLGRLVVATA